MSHEHVEKAKDFKERTYRSKSAIRILLDELLVEVDEYNKQVHGIEKKDYSALVERLVTVEVADNSSPSTCSEFRPEAS